MKPTLAIVQPAPDFPEPDSGFNKAMPLSDDAKRLASAIAAMAPRFRALDNFATGPSVERVKASIPELRLLLDKLEAEL